MAGPLHKGLTGFAAGMQAGGPVAPITPGLPSPWDTSGQLAQQNALNSQQQRRNLLIAMGLKDQAAREEQMAYERQQVEEAKAKQAELLAQLPPQVRLMHQLGLTDALSSHFERRKPDEGVVTADGNVFRVGEDGLESLYRKPEAAPDPWDGYKFDDSNVWGIGPDGPQIVASSPQKDPAELTAAMRLREVKIAEAMALNGIDRAAATALVDGQIRTNTDPVMGGGYKNNLASGETTRFGRGSGSPDSGGASVPPTSGGDASPFPSPAGRSGLDDIAASAGGWPVLKDFFVNRLFGQVAPEAVDENLAESRAKFQTLRNRLVAALSISGRPPVIEQQRIEDVLPSTGVIESEKNARTILRTLRGELVRQYQADAEDIRAETLPPDVDRDVRRRMQEVRNLIEMLDAPSEGAGGAGGGGGISGSNRRLRYDAQGNRIE